MTERDPRARLTEIAWTVTLALLCAALVIVSTVLMADGCDVQRRRRQPSFAPAAPAGDGGVVEHGCAEALAPTE